MRRVLWGCIAALTLATGFGCAGDSPSGLSAAQFDGIWELDVQGGETCDGASGPHVRYFEISEAQPGVSGGVFNVVEEWDFQRPYRFGWLVTGNVNIAQRTVELNFWQSTLSVGGVFTGSVAADGTLTGTFLDPKPGYAPHLALSSCSYTATGRRTGPLP